MSITIWQDTQEHADLLADLRAEAHAKWDSDALSDAIELSQCHAVI